MLCHTDSVGRSNDFLVAFEHVVIIHLEVCKDSGPVHSTVLV